MTPSNPNSQVWRPCSLGAAFVMLVVLTTSCSGAGADTDAPPDAKVTVAGDSISVGVGSSLRGTVDDRVTVKVIGEGGTGLARPDRFDWPARLEELARDFPPDVLVMSLGSNDAQDLTDPSGRTVVTRSDPQAWEDEYRARLARSFDAFEGTGVQVVWLGHVRTEEALVAETNRRIHEAALDLAADRDWVSAEDLAELTGSGDDEISTCLTADGLHLGTECYGTAAGMLSERLGLSG